MLGFCAVLIVILWVFQTVLLTETYKLVRRAEIEQAVALVEENIDSSDLQTVLNDLEASKEIRVMPAQEFVLPELPIARPERSEPDRPRMETVAETREFTRADGNTVSFTFYAIITPVEATISTLRFQLYIIVAIMVLFSVALAIIIARRIAKPIEELSAGAKALANGNYVTHFDGHGFLEITELSDTLNTAADELAKVENLRRELMANVSHDLRTPLALIYGYAEMMHDFPAEVTPQQTQTIMDEAKRLTGLVNDVLDVSRLETGRMELNLSAYNLTESLRGTTMRTAELVKNDGYDIRFESGCDAFVRADEIKITQAFYNLLVNAVHYSTADKTIVVCQSIADGRVKVAVIDSGEGIAPEDIPYIWQRYYKVDKQHRRAVAGTGLGLSIVKKIVELHSGACGVDSQPGKGSTFWFELPIV